MLMGFLGSLMNLFVTCLDGQFLSLRTISSWVTQALTPELVGPDFVFHRLRTTKLSPHLNVGFTHAKCSLAAKEILMLAVTGQSPWKVNLMLDRVLVPWFSSADRRFRKWEDVVFDSFAWQYEDHPVTRWDASDITAVALAALHHELAVDPLRWWIQLWYTAGTYDQLPPWRRQIQSYIDAYSDHDNVSLADSRFHTGSRRAGDALVPSLRRHVARQMKDFRETEPAQRRFRGRVWLNAGGVGGDSAGAGGAKCRRWEQMVDVVKLSKGREAVGKERRPVAGASRRWQNDVSWRQRQVLPALRWVAFILEVLV